MIFQKELEKQYTTARPGFITILLEALYIHSKKNNDYNGKNTQQLYNDFETKAKFADIRRKYSRMYHLVVENNEMMVDEKIEDTALDLVVYSALFLEYIKELKSKQNQ